MQNVGKKIMKPYTGLDVDTWHILQPHIEDKIHEHYATAGFVPLEYQKRKIAEQVHNFFYTAAETHTFFNSPLVTLDTPREKLYKLYVDHIYENINEALGIDFSPLSGKVVIQKIVDEDEVTKIKDIRGNKMYVDMFYPPQILPTTHDISYVSMDTGLGKTITSIVATKIIVDMCKDYYVSEKKKLDDGDGVRAIKKTFDKSGKYIPSFYQSKDEVEKVEDNEHQIFVELSPPMKQQFIAILDALELPHTILYSSGYKYTSMYKKAKDIYNTYTNMFQKYYFLNQAKKHSENNKFHMVIRLSQDASLHSYTSDSRFPLFQTSVVVISDEFTNSSALFASTGGQNSHTVSHNIISELSTGHNTLGMPMGDDVRRYTPDGLFGDGSVENNIYHIKLYVIGLNANIENNTYIRKTDDAVIKELVDNKIYVPGEFTYNITVYGENNEKIQEAKDVFDEYKKAIDKAKKHIENDDSIEQILTLTQAACEDFLKHPYDEIGISLFRENIQSINEIIYGISINQQQSEVKKLEEKIKNIYDDIRARVNHESIIDASLEKNLTDKSIVMLDDSFDKEYITYVKDKVKAKGHTVVSRERAIQEGVPDKCVLVGKVREISTGINLQEFDSMTIMYINDLTFAKLNQSLGRIDRVGNKKNKASFLFVAIETDTVNKETVSSIIENIKDKKENEGSTIKMSHVREESHVIEEIYSDKIESQLHNVSDIYKHIKKISNDKVNISIGNNEASILVAQELLNLKSSIEAGYLSNLGLTISDHELKNEAIKTICETFAEIEEILN